MTSNYTKSSSVALKRKRDELDSHNDSLDRGHSGSSKIRELLNVKNIPQTQASDIQSDITPATARLLPSGDFVSLSTTDITLIQDIFDPTNRKLISIPIVDCHIENLERGLSVSVGFGNTRDIIACFDEGEYGTVLKFEQNPSHQKQNQHQTVISWSILLTSVGADGTVTSSQQGVALSDEKEKISSALNTGDYYIVGTTKGDLYVIRQETGMGGKSMMMMEPLRRSQNVFVGLFQTGAKMLGLGLGMGLGGGGGDGGRAKAGGGGEAGAGVTSIFLSGPSDGSSSSSNKLLFTVSQDVLALWTGWTQSGEEQLLWESSLRNILLNDLREALQLKELSSVSDGMFSILGLEPLPAESESNSGSILVLSCMRDAESTSSSSSSFTLWLHVLSFVSTAHPSHKSAASKRSGTSTGAGAGQESDGPLIVKGRLRVAEHADIDLKNRQRAGNPQLLRLLLRRAAEQSWRLYISWLSAVSGTLRTTHIDVKSLPDLSNPTTAPAPDCRDEQRALDSSEASSEDTGVGTESLVSITAVKGQEGVCILSTDGSVLLSSPPLQHRAHRSRFALNPSFAATRQSVEQLKDVADRVADAMKVLMSVCLGESSLKSSALRLESMLSGVSHYMLGDAVVELSSRITNKESLGQNWGLSTVSGTGVSAGERSTVKSRSRGRAQGQLARRLVTDKLDAHRRLIDTLSETGIFEIISEHTQRNSVMWNHQRLLGSAGLCAALEEAQQRVGTDPNADADALSSVGGLRERRREGGLFDSIDDAPGDESETDLATGVSSHTASTLRACNARFLHTASKEGLRVIASGMERAVRDCDSRAGAGVSNLSKEDLASRGLSTADVFFAKVTELSEGMLAISSALKAQSDSLTARGVLLPAAYGVAGYFLAALQAAQGTGTAAGVGAGSGSWVEDVGSRDAASALVCDQNVRMAVLSVMGVLRSACEKAAATALSSGNIIPTLKNGFTIAHDQAGSGSGAGSGSVGVKGRGRGRQVVDMLLPSGAALESYFEQQGIGRMQEGKKLKMLSSLVLEGFVLASGRSSSSSSSSVPVPVGSPDAELSDAKDRLVGTLLQMGHYEAGFDLSALFLHPKGMLEALDLAAGTRAEQGMNRRFKEVITKSKDVKVTGSITAMTYCLGWLEARGRPMALLDIGKIAPTQLNSFLESRPHIDWVKQISSESFSAAASGAVGHSCGETRSATASTLLSIAKLSAMLSSPSPCPSDPPSSSSSSSAIARARAKLRVSSGVKSIAKDNNTRSKHLYSSRSDAAREASANLAVLAAHSTILREDSSILNDCGDVENRMPPLLIVDKLLLLAQVRGAGLQMQQPASSVDAVQDIVGYLSLALGLLSMQRDRSDALSASVVEGKERHEVKGDRELEIEGAGRAHDLDLAVADTQLKSLWAIALRVQESLWLDIVVSSSLKNAQGEDGRDGDALYSASDGLMSSSVFGLLIAECKASAREGLLRKDMIPSVPGADEEEEEEEEEGGGGRGGDGETPENNQRSRLSLKSLLSSLDFTNSPDWQRMQHLVLGSDTSQLQSLHR